MRGAVDTPTEERGREYKERAERSRGFFHAAYRDEKKQARTRESPSYNKGL